MQPHDFERLNIIGRYAYALTCVEQLCRAWGVIDPFVWELIDVHWTLTGKQLLSDGRRHYDWFAETRTHALRTPDDLAACLESQSLSGDQVQTLHHAVEELRLLGGSGMFCMPESYTSMSHLLNVVGMLVRWGVPLPSLEPFKKADYPPGEFGYGSIRFSRADFLGTASGAPHQVIRAGSTTLGKGSSRPARKRHHLQVREALVKDGWTITHDPLPLQWGTRDCAHDLGRWPLLGAEKASRTVAVELSSLAGDPDLEAIYWAVGRFIIFATVLAQVEPERELYLAVNDQIYLDGFQEPIIQLLLRNARLRLLVFDPPTQTIREWVR